MNILTIDTVLDKTYISILFDGNEIYKTIESDENNYHSVYLIKVLNEILKENNINLADFNYIGVNRGVGSFTGIRVGLTIAKIIANRLNIKTIPLETAEVLSRAYNNKNIMLDARRNSVFYSTDGKTLEMIPYEKAKEILQTSNNKFIADKSLTDKFLEFQDKFIVYEKECKNLAKEELSLAKEKVEKNEIQNAFSIKPLYIQTPPVYSKG